MPFGMMYPLKWVPTESKESFDNLSGFRTLEGYFALRAKALVSKRRNSPLDCPLFSRRFVCGWLRRLRRRMFIPPLIARGRDDRGRGGTLADH